MLESKALYQRIEAFDFFGRILQDCAKDQDVESDLHQIVYKGIKQSLSHNPWFIPVHMDHALDAIGKMLCKEKISQWVSHYKLPEPDENKSLNIGVIMAGNIPAVGFHDFLCVLVSGNKITAKLSSGDPFLLPAFSEILKQVHREFENLIYFTDDKNLSCDAVIATGSNNTARYFEYRYGPKPHIFRRNRNGVAVLNGNETLTDLQNLARDIFLHFGLGCRNVSKLYLPAGYDFSNLMHALGSGAYVSAHQPYMNNYRHTKALLQMQGAEFIDTGFLLMLESKVISSPVAVLHYEFYDDPSKLPVMIASAGDQIQCVAGNKEVYVNAQGFGKLQQPAIDDYADGIDIMEFIAGLGRP